MNYANGSADKGFSVFKVKDKKTVRSYNDLRLSSVFSDKSNNIGDTEYHSASEGLELLKKECTSLSKHLQSAVKLDLGDIMGGCNADYSIKNRLINSV